MDMTTQILATRKDELLAQIGKRDDIAIEPCADPVDAVEPALQRNAAAQRKDQLWRDIAAIDRSLRRLRLGTYGLCVDCGEAINARRLELVPWAERCVRCQEQMEL